MMVEDDQTGFDGLNTQLLSLFLCLILGLCVCYIKCIL